MIASLHVATSLQVRSAPEKREIFVDNLLVRVHVIIEMSRSALRHGTLNSLFQVALYLPSCSGIASRGYSKVRTRTARGKVLIDLP